MFDSSVAAAAALAGVGLLASYQRLRVDFDRVTAMLSTTLLAGATPLLRLIVEGGVVDAALFAVLAVLTLGVATRPRHAVASMVVVAAAVLVLPLVAPDALVAPTLFSSGNGLLSLTPVVYVAVLGLIASMRAFPAEGAAALLALALWPVTGTGLVPAVALVAPGLAAAIRWAHHRPLLAAAPLVVAALLWNYWLMVQYTAGTIPKDAPVSFAAMVRQQADVHTRQPYVYPFAFPGNVVAAWQEGIPLGRYDLLASEAAEDHFDIGLDSGADRYLLDGWGAAGSNARGAFRVIINRQAGVIFPLRAQEGGVEIHVMAALRTRQGGPDTADARIVLNGQDVGMLRVSGPEASESRVTISAADASRTLRAGYNRLLIVPTRPGQIVVHRLRIAPSA